MKSNTAIDKNTVVIIPSYEPPHTLIDYTKELLNYGVSEVLVVNDGSGEKYADVYKELTGIEGCTVIGYSENHGKGYALKTAFAYCKSAYNNDTVFVTADCDGQHIASDVINVASGAAQHPHMLVLGSRDFSDPSVPVRSSSGNIWTRRIFRLLYRISLSDTQTGLRAFSYELLDELLKINGNRFEYEMNMLIVLHKAHIKIVEIPIKTVYNEKADDVERVSHFRTFTDSMRVIGTLFKNLGWYMISSVLSSVVDVVAFYLLFRFAFNMVNPWLQTLLATVLARVASSIINFTFNFKLVFNGQSKRAIIRYYILWTFQLAASYGLAFVWTNVFSGHELLVTALKGVTDLCLALLSYQIQSRWVFSNNKRDKLHFYGPLFRFSKKIFNTFVPKYKSFVIPDDNKPSVYVCRHLNLHGPIKVAQSLDFDTHFFVLNCFTTFKKCYRQYSDYTFTERHARKGISAFFGKVRAFFAAAYVAPLVRSSKPIPVYRGGSDSLVTFRCAMEYLSAGENVIVFPDVEYTADSNTASEIYSGFLFIDKLYYRKHGKHLTFRVLDINDEKQTITESGAVTFMGGIDFSEEQTTVAESIKNLLMKNA